VVVASRRVAEVSGRGLVWLPIVAVAGVLGRFAARRGDAEVVVLLLVALVVGLLISEKAVAIVPLIPIVAVSSQWAVPPSVWFGRFAVLGALAAWALVRGRLHRRFSFSPLLPVLVVSALTLLTAGNLVLSVQRWISLVFLAGALAYLRGRWESSSSVLFSDVRMVCLVGGATGVASVAGFLLAPEKVTTAGRLAGLFWNPNSIGLVASLTVPGLVALSICLAGRRRLLWGVLGVGLAVALVLSGSRGGIVAAAAGTLAVVVGLGRRHPMRTAVVGVVLVLVAVASILGGIGVRRVPEEHLLSPIGTASNRLPGAMAAIQMGRQRLLLGRGFGSSDHFFAQEASRLGAEVPGAAPHNGYLEAFLDMGLGGVLVLGWVLAAVGLAAWRAVRAFPEEVGAWVVLGGLVGGAVESVAESGLLSVGSLFAYPFWLYAYAAVSLGAGEVQPGDRGGVSGAVTAPNAWPGIADGRLIGRLRVGSRGRAMRVHE